MNQNSTGSPASFKSEASERPQTATQLRERAEKIRLMAHKRKYLRDQEEERQSDLKEIQKQTAQAVMDEYDQLKTKDLSNAEKRKRSVEQRLEGHESYRQLAEEEKTLHSQIVSEGIELSYQHRMFLADLAELFQNGLTSAFLPGERA